MFCPFDVHLPGFYLFEFPPSVTNFFYFHISCPDELGM